jgi:hypothetical protein
MTPVRATAQTRCEEAMSNVGSFKCCGNCPAATNFASGIVSGSFSAVKLSNRPSQELVSEIWTRGKKTYSGIQNEHRHIRLSNIRLEIHQSEFSNKTRRTCDEQILAPSNIMFPASPSPRLQRIVIAPVAIAAARPYAELVDICVKT